MSFDSLGLSAEILRAIKACEYTTPTLIQKRAIPPILEGKDILGKAQTGTGKTASFVLPLLHLISTQSKTKKRTSPRILILAPTRELAAQVQESIAVYGKYLPLKSCVIYGGAPIKAQIFKLKKGTDVLVATPGRLLDHINRQTVDLSAIESVVLDEADCMLDMGFIHDIREIMEYLPKQRQSLLFSATFSPAIRKLAENLLRNPEVIEIAPNVTTAEQIKQVIYPTEKARKAELLSHLITTNDWKQVLVFTRTKYMADNVSDSLKEAGILTATIHGDKRQSARAKALFNFKKGKTRVLVATDIAARGIDIDQLPHVINFELPFVASDYIHRIGRTGRAGNSGEAISLVSVDEITLLQEIEELTKTKFDSVSVPGYEVEDFAIRKNKAKTRAPFQRRGKKPDFRKKGGGHFQPRKKSFNRKRSA